MALFSKIGRAVGKLLVDENLDLYVLATTAFIFTILGATGVASVIDLTSIILGLLAVLALSQIRTRRHVSLMAVSSDSHLFTRFKTSFPQDIIERRASASDLLLIGLSMSRTVQGGARTDMRRMLTRGGRVRVLVMDPTDDALLRAVSGNSSLWHSAERLKSRINGTLEELSDLQRSTGGKLEIRVAQFVLIMGFNGINLGSPEGAIIVQHYEYKPDGEACPIFELKAAEDGFWFNHYANEANRLWEAGEPWPLSREQILARVRRPLFEDSFGSELQNAIGEASSILVTGITRNGLVNSAYSKFEELLRKGCQLRFLLIDPDSDAIAQVADRYYAERSADSVRQRIRQTMRLLAELHGATGNVSLRLTKNPLALGVIATRHMSAQGLEYSTMFVEYYPYRSAGAQPKFVLQPTDGYWYERFLAEADALWADATDFPLT